MSAVEELRAAVSAEDWKRAGAVRVDPAALSQDDARLYWLLVTRLQLEAGDRESAHRTWQTVKAVEGAWRPVDHLAAGLVFHKLGKQSEALTQFQEALRVAPEDGGAAYESMAEMFHAQGQPPHITVPFFQNAALCYSRAGLRTEMQRACRKGLALDGRHAGLLALLG